MLAFLQAVLTVTFSKTDGTKFPFNFESAEPQVNPKVWLLRTVSSRSPKSEVNPDR